MADIGDDSVSEDQWLYGDSNPDQPNGNVENSEDNSKSIDPFINPDGPQGNEPQQPPGVLEPPVFPPPTRNGETEQGDGEEGSLQIDEGQEPPGTENGEIIQPESGEFEEDDDSEDDTVNVVIGDIRTAPQYGSSLNIKRGGLLTSTGLPPQLKQPGKFSIEEFEQIGTINGIAAHEYNLDSLEDKPWRKPGADITDYFNYGFNEDTWRAYCERQKRMRIHESGVGLGPLSTNVTAPMTGSGRAPVVPMDKQYMVPTGPPPSRRVTGCIDVIGGESLPTRRTTDSPPKENIIQVMTADRREYSRKGFPDMMVPPPGGVTVPPPGFQPGMPPPHLGSAPPG
ncbi:hypothetical protein J6590_054252 [Homalodisca vitripennis]|nr:hypothetical protein J6590_054252 [Homalodisca vitripennis]